MTARMPVPDSSALRSPEPSATRDALAARLQRHDRMHPAGLDLLAQGLDAAGDKLRGVAGLVAGVRGADHFRRVLRGEEAGFDVELFRLAAEARTREERAAVIEVARLLSGRVGYRLEPVAVAPPSALEALTGICVAHGALVAELAEAARDHALDAREAAAIETELAAMYEQLRRVSALVAAARAGRMGRPVPVGDGR